MVISTGVAVSSDHGVSSREIFIRQNRNGLRQPVRHFGEVGQFGSQFSRKLSGSKTPLPISAVQAGRVHAGLAAQAQHILQRDQRKLGRRDSCAARMNAQ